MTTCVPEKTTQLVHVYADHPAWGKVVKWFLMPGALLQELYIISYHVDDHADAYEINEANPQIRWIRQQHPGTLLIY